MRWIRALAPLTLAAALAACGGAPLADGSASAEPSRAPDGSSGEPPASSTGASASAGVPSDGGSPVGEGCDARMREHSDAAATLSLTWESIADTGWEVFWTDAIGEGTYWDVQGATGFRWQVTVQPAEGSGTEVKIDFYGES
jgi:hypothetical protein